VATPSSTSGTTRLLLAIAVACIGAVAAALVSQHVFDMQPCPWCILQRVIYLAIAALCLVGALWSSTLARRGIGALALLLALAGAASALYQDLVASKSTSCNLTFADKVISALGLDGAFPPLLQVTANCSDAAVTMLGVQYAYWSLALYLVIAAASIRVMLARPSRRY
jgi:disulfide bond formation protein DsbB